MARAIKEFLQEGTHLRWVPSGAQLADALTKAMESNFLRETLKYGFYRLADEQSTLKERAKTKDRLAWLKNQKQSLNFEQKEQNKENRYKKKTSVICIHEDSCEPSDMPSTGQP